ncbi:MAG: arsenate reductase ArsC [Betaproteobacteria bacterium]
MTSRGLLRILFLCTGNSCRSQMAEGWVKALHGGRIEAFSAGTEPAGVNPLAVQVMREAGVDLSGHRSKHLSEFLGREFDCAITLCDDAHAACPVFPGARQTVHVGFPDPARAAGSPEEILAEFRRVRDLIRDFVARLPERLQEVGGDA